MQVISFFPWPAAEVKWSRISEPGSAKSIALASSFSGISMNLMRSKAGWRDNLMKPPWLKPQIAIVTSPTSLITMGNVAKVQGLVVGLRVQVDSSLVSTTRKTSVWHVPQRLCTSDREVVPLSEVRRGEKDVRSLCEDGRLEEALEALQLMEQQGTVLVEVYRCLLHACVKRKSPAIGKRVHAHIVKKGLGSNSFLGNAVVTMYARCGCLTPALNVLTSLPRHSVSLSTWTALILEYTRCGQVQEAFRVYQEMKEEGVKPNSYTFVGILKACTDGSDLKRGKQLHDDIRRCNLESDLFVGTTLVKMYAKCGSMEDAMHVFDALPQRDVVSWSAMIAGYAQQDQAKKALELYGRMQEDKRLKPDMYTFSSLLKACGSLATKEQATLSNGRLLKIESLQKAREIHDEARTGGYESEIFVGSSLVDCYAKCGDMVEAQHVFDKLSRRDVVSWTAMITGYAQQEDQGDKALQIYEDMLQNGVRPDRWAFASVLKACGSMASSEAGAKKALPWAKRVHGAMVEMGYASDVIVGTALVHLYAKCGNMLDAQQVFDTLSHHDVVSWSALIGGYAQEEHGGKALELYDQMQLEGATPDNWTFVSVLKGCASLAASEEEKRIDGQWVKLCALQKGRAVHAIIRMRGYDKDVFVGTSLVNMYAKCGSMQEAQEVFDKLVLRNVVSWNSLIAGYAQQEQGEKSWELYTQMRDEGIGLEEATFIAILKACTSLGALDMCRQVHEDVGRSGIEWSVTVATSLLHAYGKCGSMVDARHVFDTVLNQHDVISWNALLGGYAQQADLDSTLQCFREMQQVGIQPDGVSFLSILTACSHAGKVDKGLEFFESMCRDHGVAATVQHYTTLVDILGRAGLLNKAEDLLLTMPNEPDATLWLSLLGACRNYKDTEVGRRAFERAVRLDSKLSGAYMLMSGIYAHDQLWGEADKIEELRGGAQAWKKPGQSWIEHGYKVHMFMVGDLKHPELGQVHAKLHELDLQIKAACTE